MLHTQKKGNRIVPFKIKKIHVTKKIIIFQYFWICHQNKIVHYNQRCKTQQFRQAKCSGITIKVRIFIWKKENLINFNNRVHVSSENHAVSIFIQTARFFCRPVSWTISLCFWGILDGLLFSHHFITRFIFFAIFL